jgi:hypothetical protein
MHLIRLRIEPLVKEAKNSAQSAKGEAKSSMSGQQNDIGNALGAGSRLKDQPLFKRRLRGRFSP